jgi:N-acetylmuramoyl-L-alanine amidase
MLSDVKVVYTRTTDVFLELHERAEIANAANADLFICVHCNSACRFDKAKRKEVCNPVIHGAETYVMGLHKTEANLEVAKRENDVILLEKDYTTHYEGFDPNSSEANIIFSLYQNTFMEQSLRLASFVQEQLGAKGRSSRGVKPAGFWVLFKTAMPSVLIETGFLSHPEEEKFLSSADGQQTIASGIFKAFRQYHRDASQEQVREEKPLTGNPPVDTVRPDRTETNGNTAARNIPHSDTASTDPAPTGAVWFSVQLVSSDKQLSPNDPRFKNVLDVREDKVGSVFKYCYGRTSSYREAVAFQSKMRSSGFKDAFLVAYRNKERIPVQEAVQSIKDNPK